jgi:N-acetylglucosaminyl-diphospho-decaprenol L-rhamnosyltransferase
VENQLLVVIVNYRTAELASACLRSLEPEVAALRGCQVVVVDNDSRDGSAEQLASVIAQNYASWAELLPLDYNGGFAQGNNAAIRRALHGAAPAFVYLLNPDTQVRPGALSELLQFAEAHPRAGIMGSRCDDAEGNARSSAFRFHSVLGELESEAAFGPVSRLLKSFAIASPPSAAAERTDWVSGAAMLVRRQVFEQIGLLDEDFFLYYEETDFARRAKQHGFECWYVPRSRVVHYCGQATGITGERAAQTRVPNYWYASRRRYFTKHHGRLYAALADTAWLAGASIRRTRHALRARAASDPPRRYSDFIQYNLPRWVQS